MTYIDQGPFFPPSREDFKSGAGIGQFHMHAGGLTALSSATPARVSWVAEPSKGWAARDDARSVPEVQTLQLGQAPALQEAGEG